jgi:hypothetical protein
MFFFSLYFLYGSHFVYLGPEYFFSFLMLPFDLLLDLSILLCYSYCVILSALKSNILVIFSVIPVYAICKRDGLFNDTSC